MAARTLIANDLVRLDSTSSISLQAQVRGQLASAILAGIVEVGARLPSSRKLGRELGVSRITITVAYQQLVADGFIVGRERSGYFVASGLRSGLAESSARAVSPMHFDWAARIKRPAARSRAFRCPSDWRRYPYPFIDGRFDPSLYPVNEWREASRLALGVSEIMQWSVDSGDADDPFLIEQIRTKILPRRGIEARPEEILVTVGTQQGLSLVTELLIDAKSRVAVEEPGYPDLRQMLRRQKATVVNQPVDDGGMLVDENLDGCQAIFVTPSHQLPTAATMPLDRREALLAQARADEALIVEDDIDCETNYGERAPPALRALDSDGRVIYIAELSKMLAPALRLGFVVAAPELIDELRQLRRLAVRHPPLNNQRTAAFFLSLGHYDAAMMRLCREFRDRQLQLRDALNHYLPDAIEVRLSRGGTAFWVQGPPELDAQRLATEAARRGVLIEPVNAYFALKGPPRNVFRMGITSLSGDRIRAGVATLATIIRELVGVSPVTEARSVLASEVAIREALTGATILCRTVYGEPFTIALKSKGKMEGIAGYANEDRDTGHWWIEGDVWYRQWNDWAYGEPLGLRVAVEEQQILWFTLDGRLIDRGIIAR